MSKSLVAERAFVYNANDIAHSIKSVSFITEGEKHIIKAESALNDGSGYVPFYMDGIYYPDGYADLPSGTTIRCWWDDYDEDDGEFHPEGDLIISVEDDNSHLLI